MYVTRDISIPFNWQVTQSYFDVKKDDSNMKDEGYERGVVGHDGNPGRIESCQCAIKRDTKKPNNVVIVTFPCIARSSSPIPYSAGGVAQDQSNSDGLRSLPCRALLPLRIELLSRISFAAEYFRHSYLTNICTYLPPYISTHIPM